MIFVDTSAFVALVDSDDIFYQKASEWWKTSKSSCLVTTNFVVAETLGWLRYKRGKKIAVKVGENLLFSDDLKTIRAERQDENKAWKLFNKVEGRGISMIDCISFAVMKRLKIKQVFAFDQDFADVGFNVLPEWSLTQ